MKSAETNETNLGDLIRTIKTEGVDKANKQSEEIIAEAEKRAAEIVADAREEADAIINEATLEIEKRESAGKSSIDLAARDALISLKNSIIQLFNRLFEEESRSVMKPETVEKLIVNMIEGWQSDSAGEGKFEVLLSEKNKDELSGEFLKRLKESMKKGVELMCHPDVKSGFRIGEKDGHLYYDFTDKAIAELLSAHLSPNLARLIDELARNQDKM